MRGKAGLVDFGRDVVRDEPARHAGRSDEPYLTGGDGPRPRHVGGAARVPARGSVLPRAHGRHRNFPDEIGACTAACHHHLRRVPFVSQAAATPRPGPRRDQIPVIADPMDGHQLERAHLKQRDIPKATIGDVADHRRARSAARHERPRGHRRGLQQQRRMAGRHGGRVNLPVSELIRRGDQIAISRSCPEGTSFASCARPRPSPSGSSAPSGRPRGTSARSR